MKTLLHNKVKFLTLIFLALFLTAFSSPSPRPGTVKNGVKKEYKHAYRTLKGVCHSQKTKEYKKSTQYRSYHKKVYRSR